MPSCHHPLRCLSYLPTTRSLLVLVSLPNPLALPLCHPQETQLPVLQAPCRATSTEDFSAPPGQVRSVPRSPLWCLFSHLILLEYFSLTPIRSIKGKLHRVKLVVFLIMVSSPPPTIGAQ